VTRKVVLSTAVEAGVAAEPKTTRGRSAEAEQGEVVGATTSSVRSRAASVEAAAPARPDLVVAGARGAAAVAAERRPRADAADAAAARPRRPARRGGATPVRPSVRGTMEPSLVRPVQHLTRRRCYIQL